LEKGQKPPPANHETKALDRLADLERAVAAAELVQRRATQRVDELLSKHADQISEAAERRLASAKAAYMKAIAELEAATGDLVVASALSTWAADPAGYYKERGIRAVPLPPMADEPTIDIVIQALREVVEPREHPLMPSPFGTVVQPEPAVEPTPAPAA
jgi:hypothetical protein